MLCPRCKQGSSVQEEEGHQFCHACSIRFNNSTQVIRPILPESIWVELGTGNLVRVLDVGGDSFDPSTPIRYKTDLYASSPPSVMLAEDFRFYFRPRKDPKPPKAIQPGCKVLEEWESKTGLIYTVLHVNRDGDVFLVAADADHLSFWVKGQDFVRMFTRFNRPTDYERLLDDS